MLEARSVALVGASARPGTFGSRMLEEVGKSRARPRIYPVNPRYAELDGRRCYPSLADLPEVPDLVLLAVPDRGPGGAAHAGRRCGSRSAVIFGNAHEDTPPGDTGRGLRDRLAAIARNAGMALCGPGCMGFVNVSHGLRALGYTEADPLPAGPVALVTHSGSVFSALLRARRGFGFTLAVSSGQELVTAAPAYLDYALSLPGHSSARARARGDPGRRGPAAGARHRCRPGHPRGTADGGQFGGRPRDGGRALRRPGRLRTAAGKRWPGRTVCTGSATWRSSPTLSSCSRSAAGRARPSGPVQGRQAVQRGRR